MIFHERDNSHPYYCSVRILSWVIVVDLGLIGSNPCTHIGCHGYIDKQPVEAIARFYLRKYGSQVCSIGAAEE